MFGRAVGNLSHTIASVWTTPLQGIQTGEPLNANLGKDLTPSQQDVKRTAICWRHFQ